MSRRVYLPAVLGLALLTTNACQHQAAVVAPAAPTMLTSDEEGLRAELVTEGPAASRVVANDGADLVLLYGGEEAGALGPCGCKKRPRGGLARVAAYRDAAHQADPDTPTLLLQTGNWLDPGRALDGSPRADAPNRNSWMVRGMAALAPDAVNLGASDMQALDQIDSGSLPLLSANLSHSGVTPWLQLQAGELKVGIVGVAAPGPGWMAPEGWTTALPEAAAQAVIQDHADEVDVVVLLALGATDAARALARRGLVDVVIDADTHRDFSPPFRVGHAVWVRSHDQTMRLGELRIHMQDGRVSQAWDRKIDLDEAVHPEPALQAMTRQAELAIAATERALYGRRLR